MKNIFLTIAFLLNCSSIYSFENLKEIRTFAQRYPEFPKADNDNWYNPDYTTFYQKLKAKWWDKILLSLNMKKIYFPKEKFINNLKELTKARKASIKNSRYVISLHVKEDTKFVVWGDVQAAFHSLARELQDLKTQGIMDEDLKILKSNYYFVFVGDLVNRNPYSLPTLEIVLSLMKKNPDKVIYLKGQHEDRKYWQNFSMAKEIQIFSKSPKEIADLTKLIDTFFATLPLALYIALPDTPKDMIRISHFGREIKEVNENDMNEFYIHEDNKEIKLYDVTKKIEATNEANVEAIIRGEDRSSFLSKTKGLTLLESQNGATTWSLLSAATKIYKDFYKFFEDSYIFLTIKKPIEKSIISLRTQDLQTKSGFKWKQHYNLVSGQEIDLTKTEEHKEEIVLGSSLGLTKGISDLAKKVKEGISLAIEQINASGGINGKNIRLIAFDDQFSPKLARENIEKMMKMGIDIFIGNTGTPTLQAYLDLIKDGKILVLFPPTGSEILRNEDLKGIINLRGSYADETQSLVQYVSSKFNPRSWALFYQQDTYGLEALSEAKKILGEKKDLQITEMPYAPNTTDFSKTAEKYKESLASTLGLFSNSLATQEFIRQVGVEKFFGVQLFGISPLSQEDFRRFIQQRGISVIFSQVTPNPKNSVLPIVKEYRKIISEEGLTPDSYSLEGYIAMSLLIDVLKKIDGKVTKEKILENITAFKDYNFKGLNLTFNKKHRDLSQNIWLDIGKTQWQKLDLKSLAKS